MKYPPMTISRHAEEEIRKAVQEKREAGYEIIREPFLLHLDGKSYEEKGYKRRSFYQNISASKWMAVVRKVE